MAGKKAILCVDDEEMILQSLKRQLRNRFADRYMIEVAESANEALEVIEELVDDGYDVLLIVSDWLMPNMKGDELLIRVHERFPQIVKVMLTGQANQDAIERARREAALYECVHKPWKEDELGSLIQRALG